MFSRSPFKNALRQRYASRGERTRYSGKAMDDINSTSSHKMKSIDRRESLSTDVIANRPFRSNSRSRASSAPSLRSNYESPSTRYTPSSMLHDIGKILTKITTARKSEYHPRKALASHGSKSYAHRSKSPSPQRYSRRINTTKPDLDISHLSVPSIKPGSVRNRKGTPINSKHRKNAPTSDELQFQGTMKGTTEYFEKLSEAVLSATNNLAAVSTSLQNMAVSLLETIESHSKLVNSFHSDPNSNPSSRHLHSSTPFSAYSPDFANRITTQINSPERSPGISQTNIVPHSNIRSLQDPFSEIGINSPAGIGIGAVSSSKSLSNSGMKATEFDVSGLNESNADKGQLSEELVELIRSALHQKLTSLLSS